MSIKIQSLLHGCEPKRIQSVGFMQVIPLVSDLHDDRFVSPSNASVSTSGYGHLKVRNQSDKPMIVPMGATYIVDQAAQNHALPHAGVVKARALHEYNTAMCVQASQGGYISEGQHEMMLLPFPLREKAHRARKDTNFSRLWPAIAEFNNSIGVSDGRGHLELFFNAFKDQLDTFIAQFEPVHNQVGAIILIGGKVVGIERTPSPTYFSSIWRALIRECYGSLAILEAKQKGTPPVPRTRVALRKVVSVGDLKIALGEAVTEERSRVSTLINNILNVELDTERDATETGFQIDGLGGSSFVGQLIRDSEKVVYASIISTEHWRKNEDWLMAAPFKM